MPNKSHKNCIEFHQNILEDKFNLKCKREFDMARKIGDKYVLHRLDLACFGKLSVGMEVETNKNFDNAQIRSNKEDLEEFKKFFPNAKVFHITTEEVVDFEKELNSNLNKPWLKPIVQNNRPYPYNLKNNLKGG